MPLDLNVDVPVMLFCRCGERSGARKNSMLVPPFGSHTSMWPLTFGGKKFDLLLLPVAVDSAFESGRSADHGEALPNRGVEPLLPANAADRPIA